MTCLPLTDTKGKRVVGFVCIANHFERLSRGIYLEWHNYLGPSFYSDKDYSKPIEDWWENPRIVELFNAWHAKHKEQE